MYHFFQMVAKKKKLEIENSCRVSSVGAGAEGMVTN